MIDGLAIANRLRDAPDHEVREFFEGMVARLSDREWKMLKEASRDLETVRAERARSLARHKADEERRREERERTERPQRLAAQYSAFCAALFEAA